MYNATDFIKWALSHAKKETVPSGAVLPVPISSVGTDPWEYLFGTTGHTITASRLEERFENHYSRNGWTRSAFDNVTSGWIGRKATDCQGLLDAYITEQGTKTDVNANYCYTAWSTDKGKIGAINREYVIGEGVFTQNSEGRISHVGFVCGFLDGKPLIVEARGIRYGVVVSKLSERTFTHRGLITKQFNYTDINTGTDGKEAELFALTNPMQTGEPVRKLQAFLNDIGYRDNGGKLLSEDGKLGAKTWSAFQDFIAVHSATIDPDIPDSLTVTIIAGDKKYMGVIERG